jgi:hypothetical protein
MGKRKGTLGSSRLNLNPKAQTTFASAEVRRQGWRQSDGV